MEWRVQNNFFASQLWTGGGGGALVCHFAVRRSCKNYLTFQKHTFLRVSLVNVGQTEQLLFSEIS
jgi:hypothetical protein